MGSIADKWFGIDPPKAPAVPTLPPPPGMPESGGSTATLRRARQRSGRAATILAGDLVPMDIGKRTLLG